MNSRLKEAIQDRDRLDISSGSQIWALSGSREGRVRSEIGEYVARTVPSDSQVRDHAVKLEIAGTPYQVFSVVQVSQLKLVRLFSYRPMKRLRVNEAERVDFDEAPLPEDG